MSKHRRADVDARHLREIDDRRAVARTAIGRRIRMFHRCAPHPPLADRAPLAWEERQEWLANPGKGLGLVEIRKVQCTASLWRDLDRDGGGQRASLTALCVGLRAVQATPLALSLKRGWGPQWTYCLRVLGFPDQTRTRTGLHRVCISVPASSPDAT